MERTPYDRHRLNLHLSGLFFARYGYVVALQDIRGRGDSGGDYRYLYNYPTEADDGYDACEWLAEQDWCNGKVGTFGISHTGATQQALALGRPPHLVTQILGDTGWNYYQSATRQGGAWRAGSGVQYPIRMARTSKYARESRRALEALERDLRNVPELLKKLPIRPETMSLRYAPTYAEWLTNITTRGVYDDYWRNPGASVEDFVDQYPDVPLLLYTSWYGHHPQGNFIKYNALSERLSSPIKLICGIWTHGWGMMSVTHSGEVEFGLEAALGELNSLRLQWFDHFMKGYRTPIVEGPPIELFVMGGGSGLKDAAGRMIHGGSWRKAGQWPLPNTEFTSYYLHADGSLSPEPPGESDPPTSYTYNPNDPVPTIGGNFQDPEGQVKGLSMGGAYNQRGRSDIVFCKDTLPLSMRPDVLVFQTPELTEPVELTGPITVKLWISSTAVDTDFTAKLVDVCPPNEDYPDGFDLKISESILRVRYRNGFDRAEMMEPGQVYEITIEPQPTSNRFMPGHRIRLDISSSGFPLWDANTNSGEAPGKERRKVIAHNTVYHDAERPSHVVLPVVPRG
jgi:putative CocE/NonD family hydrolase